MATPFVLSSANGSARDAGSPATDADDVVERAAHGDMLAFRMLYERYRIDVARLAFRMVGSHCDIEDLVQDVFVHVFRSLPEFRGQSKFRTWLHRVTVNVVLMARRTARSRPVLDGEPPAEDRTGGPQGGPDEDAERHERMRAFERVLDCLGDKKRVVFVLHELEGLPPREIAKIVGAPVLTVRTRLYYARREIESKLAAEPALAGMDLSFSPRKSDGGEAP
jgi:RNA polymerase sigma-70 factor (ECF subfamily)